MQQGWIKLYRKLRENPIYKNSKAVHVWIECLFRATHHETDYFLKRQKIKLKPGQFCMGRAEFADTIGMSPSTAWFWLHQFEVDSMIDIKKTSKGSIVTIKRWNEYQKLTAELTTKKQQKNTNKNDKNEKNIISGASPEFRKKMEEAKQSLVDAKDINKNKKPRIKNYWMERALYYAQRWELDEKDKRRLFGLYKQKGQGYMDRLCELSNGARNPLAYLLSIMKDDNTRNKKGT